MSNIETIKTRIQRFNRWVCFAGMLLVLPLMLLTTADVISRSVWSRGIPGIVELSSYMLEVFLLLGLAYTQQVKGHIQVSMLTSRMPAAVQRRLGAVTTALSLFTAGLLAWQGFSVGMDETAVSDLLRIPQRPFRLLVGLSAALLCLELLVDLAACLRCGKRGA